MTATTHISGTPTAAHRSAARELATALARFAAEGTVDAFCLLVGAWRMHLDARECAMVAWSALRACEPEDLPAVLEGALPELPAGWPEVPFLLEFLLEDAALWADCAWPQELRAYALASLAKMPAQERKALMRALDGGTA